MCLIQRGIRFVKIDDTLDELIIFGYVLFVSARRTFVRFSIREKIDPTKFGCWEQNPFQYFLGSVYLSIQNARTRKFRRDL